ncbi:MAG: transposase [Kordiimonadaceae bacterium]|nr:transposase [Kordiimonadaceae bacterium]
MIPTFTGPAISHKNDCLMQARCLLELEAYELWRSRRRSKWGEAFRCRIVAEAEASDEPMSEVAKRHGLNPKLLYSWRQRFLKDQETATTGKIEGTTYIAWGC